MFDLEGFLTLEPCFEEHFLTSRNPLSGPLEELAHTHIQSKSQPAVHICQGGGAARSCSPSWREDGEWESHVPKASSKPCA
jgi:hypothetical protein